MKPKSPAALADLQANPRNPRYASPERIAVLSRSLARFGDLSGIVFNRRSKKLVGGHQRVEAFKSDAQAKMQIVEELPKPDKQGTIAWGFVTVAGARHTYREVDWSGPTETAAMIAANNQAGEWDEAILGPLLLELKDSEMMPLLGFSDDELARILMPPTVTTKQTYTHKIVSPIYKPKGEKPKVKDLFDEKKTRQLCQEVDQTCKDPEVAAFLKLAAERHTVFHFGRIAEFYCHASPAVKALMEKSGLVIIDFDNAIENGFVKMTERLGALIGIETGEQIDNDEV